MHNAGNLQKNIKWTINRRVHMFLSQVIENAELSCATTNNIQYMNNIKKIMNNINSNLVSDFHNLKFVPNFEGFCCVFNHMHQRAKDLSN